MTVSAHRKQKKGVPEKNTVTVQLPENQKLANKIAGVDKVHYELLQETFGCEIKRRQFTLSVFSSAGEKDDLSRDKTVLALNMFIALHHTKKHVRYEDLLGIIDQVEQEPDLLNSLQHFPMQQPVQSPFAQYPAIPATRTISNKADKTMTTNKNKSAHTKTSEKTAPTEAKGTFILKGTNGNIFATSENQKRLVTAVEKDDLVFAVGQAGTGKTYTGVALAVKALKEKSVKRIIITRPAVEAEEKLGFLPGDMKEKLDPYLRPIYDALRDMVPNETMQKMIEDNVIEIAPLAFMRGRTLDNAFVILDEAQNTTEGQMKMVLTRMGKDAKYFVTGDMSQTDLPPRTRSGLEFATEALKDRAGVSIIKLKDEDNMRHKLVKDMIADFNTLDQKRDAQIAKRKAEETAANQNFKQNGHEIIATERLAANAVNTPENGNGAHTPRHG